MTSLSSSSQSPRHPWGHGPGGGRAQVTLFTGCSHSQPFSSPTPGNLPWRAGPPSKGTKNQVEFPTWFLKVPPFNSLLEGCVLPTPRGTRTLWSQVLNRIRHHRTPMAQGHTPMPRGHTHTPQAVPEVLSPHSVYRRRYLQLAPLSEDLTAQVPLTCSLYKSVINPNALTPLETDVGPEF